MKKRLVLVLGMMAACQRAPQVNVTLLSIADEINPEVDLEFTLEATQTAFLRIEKELIPVTEPILLPEGFSDVSMKITARAFIGERQVAFGTVDVSPGEEDATIRFAVCSNGATEAEELCDDADVIDGDGCDSTCKPTGCNSDVFTPGEVCFSTQNPVVANAAPSDVKVADMNGDQLPDFVASYPSQQQIRVFLGTADNQFGNFVDVPDSLLGLVGTGDDQRRISVLDIDNDGTLDIVTSIKVGGAFFVGAFLNKGDSTFSAGGAVFAGNDIRDVALADLDGDQLPDLIALDFPSNTLRTFKSLGSGDFETSFTSTAVDAQPVALFIIDIDLDGDNDVVTANASGSISVVLNNAGTLTPNTTVTNGTPIALAAADFDGDGLIDIAVTKQAGGDFVSVFTQQPNTQPINFNNDGDFATPTNPRGLIAADVDLDGDSDIAFTSETDSSITILVNDGTAQFAPAEAPVSTPTGPKIIATGDVNRDGIPDFVTTGENLGLIFSTP